MPELPEVEAVVRKLRPALQGAVIQSVRVLRDRTTHPQPPSALLAACGQTAESVERRGKNILIHLTGDRVLRVHLRMTGNLTVVPTHLLHSTAVRVMFALQDGRGLAYEDPRALGSVNLYAASDVAGLLSEVGVDPLSDDFTPKLLADAASRSRKPVKVFLMDQRPVAGLGNIYAAESLFRARIDPRKPACEISSRKSRDLHAAVRDVLHAAIPEAEASYTHPGDYQGMVWCVYDREGLPCPRCRRAVHRIRQAGRSTYYCPSCQR